MIEIQSDYAYQTVFTSQIDVLSIVTDQQQVRVRITTVNAIEIYNEVWVPVKNKITISGLSELIEMAFIERDIVDGYISISVTPLNGSGSAGCLFFPIFCNRMIQGITASEFRNDNFLCAQKSKRIPPFVDIDLLAYVNTGDSKDFKVVYDFRILSDGRNVRNSFVVDNGGIQMDYEPVEFPVRYKDILEDAVKDLDLSVYDIELLSFVVINGNRSCTFFVDKSLRKRDVFYFRNCFNAWEIAALPMSVTAKSDVSRSLSYIDGKTVAYDNKLTRLFDVEAGPLSFQECSWIDQLLDSWNVVRPLSDVLSLPPYGSQWESLPFTPLKYSQVIITDSTCELSHSQESLNKVKFTWRYSDSFPVHSIDPSPGIFNDNYNLSFN